MYECVSPCKEKREDIYLATFLPKVETLDVLTWMESRPYSKEREDLNLQKFKGLD